MTFIPPDVYADAQLVLGSVLAGDTDRVVGTFDAVLDRSGLAGAYDLACCLAATMVGADAPLGGWMLDFPGIDEAGYDARWVARFVSAYANGDRPTGVALFGAAVEDGKLSDCLLTLAGSAVATLRRRAA
ncbi:MAG TPA: hypothetical protein VFM55_27030 [Micromonosporaceae bacterium]|nr:hypothetical protein [Micromonosporaceae bacterium]